MIVVDSSVAIDYLAGVRNALTDVLHNVLLEGRAALSPAVICELLSDPLARHDVVTFTNAVKILPLGEGYWRRAGLLRTKIRKLGLKANLGDALIAQSCIDHNLPLLTSDKDFRHYVKTGGLKLAAV